MQTWIKTKFLNNLDKNSPKTHVKNLVFSILKPLKIFSQEQYLDYLLISNKIMYVNALDMGKTINF